MASLVYWFRITAAILLGCALLEVPNLAVRDCSSGASSTENCLFLRVRSWLGLPASKLLRAGLLEAVGLAVLAGLWVAWRYVWPHAGAVEQHRGEPDAKS